MGWWRARRGWQRWLLIGVAAVLLVDAPVSAATPTDLGYRTAVWLEATLGVDVPDRPLVPLDAASCTAGGAGAGGCVAATYSNRIEVHPNVWANLTRAEEMGRDGWGEGETLLHELLHSDRDAVTPTGLAEGIVEAVAKDLYMPWTRAMRMTYWRWHPQESSYFRELDAVRKASALATGGSWRTRAARLWRRDLWRADGTNRVAIYEAAWVTTPPTGSAPR